MAAFLDLDLLLQASLAALSLPLHFTDVILFDSLFQLRERTSELQSLLL